MLMKNLVTNLKQFWQFILKHEPVVRAFLIREIPPFLNKIRRLILKVGARLAWFIRTNGPIVVKFLQVHLPKLKEFLVSTFRKIKT